VGAVGCQGVLAARVRSRRTALACEHVKMKAVRAVEVVLDYSLAGKWCRFVEDLTVVELGAINGVPVESLLLIIARER